MDAPLSKIQDPDLFAIYVHYPRCRNACGYCDFPKIRRAEFPDTAYADAVIREMRCRRAGFQGRVLDALYFGGGTPSLWATREVRRVVDAAQGWFETSPDLEVSLEANPETFDRRVAAGLREAGVTRMSIGVQSLDDGALAELTRSHTARQAEAAVSNARRAGFDVVSCDLMFGLAGQSVADHLEQIDALVALAPDHISSYALALPYGSALHRAGYSGADEDAVAEMMHRGRQALESAGFLQYEVSNFARSGRRCRHHGLVWAGRPYLGLGAWAHTLVPGADPRYPLIRVGNPALDAYERAVAERRVEGAPPVVRGAEVIKCSVELACDEVLMLGVRTVDGVDREAFRRELGLDPLQHRERVVSELVAMGLITVDAHRLRPTRRGIWFADEIALRLLAPTRAPIESARPELRSVCGLSQQRSHGADRARRACGRSQTGGRSRNA